ncbi:MAG: phosphoglycerate kinase [Oscillospiraceae bacterium]|jgi:phosphoglycerate kinase|nr:phosphoglycerate kinase [Oscillospiraceae bacterium]
MNYLNKKTVEDLDVAGKKVLVRCDLNVPVLEGKITNSHRIKESLKTINYLVGKNAKVILCSHLGRPKGIMPEFSLATVAKYLNEVANLPVKMAKDSVGADAKALAANLQNGEVVLLENLRFHEQETRNDPAFAEQLASLADFFVNDAFGAAHRAHSSTAGVCKFLPCAIGYLMLKELKILSEAINSPKRPLVAILGGAKVSDKIGVIHSLLDKVDVLILGGGMAYTFAKASGFNVGRSICEEDKLDTARDIKLKAEEKGVKLLLPSDYVVASDFSNDADFKTVPLSQIPDDYMGMDIGAETAETFSNTIGQAAGGTVIWNGPMGVCEFKNFEKGTKTLAKTIAQTDIISIIGGGDSAAAIEQMGLSEKMTHISTGGGASLKFFEGANLPGISSVDDK